MSWSTSIPDIPALETALRYHSKLDLATLFRIREARARCGFDARRLVTGSCTPISGREEQSLFFTERPLETSMSALSNNQEPLSLLIGRCLTSMSQEAAAEAFGVIFEPQNDNESLRMLSDAHEVDISELTERKSRCGRYEWVTETLNAIIPFCSAHQEHGRRRLTTKDSMDERSTDRTKALVERLINELNQRADSTVTAGLGGMDAEGLVQYVQLARDSGLPREIQQHDEVS